MGYYLLTGVTGLLGRYLLRDMLQADCPLAVLVRPTRRLTVEQRVEGLMRFWEDRLGQELPRPVVLEGDICEEDLGLDPEMVEWVSENCEVLLHNAASLTFHSTGPQSEPWRSNLGGMSNLLDLCRKTGIRQFHHISTAYVCGLREGRVFESELDKEQELGNDYERSKLKAEKMLRSAEFLDPPTIYRPGIIVGDSQTGFTTTFHGFYAALQLAHTLVRMMDCNETGKVSSYSRFTLNGSEAKNLVPVDWVSAVVTHIASSPEHHGKTYHLTPRHRTSARLVRDVLEDTTKFYGAVFHGAGIELANPTEVERLFYEHIRVYDSYWRDDPIFDKTNTCQAAPHLPCPHIDREMLIHLSKEAIEMNFSWTDRPYLRLEKKASLQSAAK